MNDFLGLLAIAGMAGNYEERKLGRYFKDGVFVSTAYVSDSDYPFETGVAHPDYNNHEVIVVESYTSKSEAFLGHKKWVKIMTAKKLPSTLLDVSTAKIRKMLCPNVLKFKRKKK